MDGWMDGWMNRWAGQILSLQLLASGGSLDGTEHRDTWVWTPDEWKVKKVSGCGINK